MPLSAVSVSGRCLSRESRINATMTAGSSGELFRNTSILCIFYASSSVDLGTIGKNGVRTHHPVVGTQRLRIRRQRAIPKNHSEATATAPL